MSEQSCSTLCTVSHRLEKLGSRLSHLALAHLHIRLQVGSHTCRVSASRLQMQIADGILQYKQLCAFHQPFCFSQTATDRRDGA